MFDKSADKPVAGNTDTSVAGNTSDTDCKPSEAGSNPYCIGAYSPARAGDSEKHQVGVPEPLPQAAKSVPHWYTVAVPEQHTPAAVAAVGGHNTEHKPKSRPMPTPQTKLASTYSYLIPWLKKRKLTCFPAITLFLVQLVKRAATRH